MSELVCDAIQQDDMPIRKRRIRSRDASKRIGIIEAVKPYAMILPALLFLSVFVIYPVINLVRLSFYTGNALNPFKKFVGLGNYKQIFFVQPEFLISLKNTAYYSFTILFFLIVLSVIFALWMQKDRKINRIAQNAFFCPYLVAGISCAFIWSWLFNSSNYGIFNMLLKKIGVNPINWLENADTAMNCVIAMNLWKNIGYYSLIIVAALKSIPKELYEAASLDNAHPIRTFFKITLPMISPQLFFLLITIITGSFKVFDSVRIMTNGGPGNSSEVISMYIYEYAFQRHNSLGIGSAAGVVLMVILVVITLFNFKGVEKHVYYQ